MALIRCSSSSGGGSGLSETVLWTNQSPTSSFAPSSATSLDTGKFSDYDYIKIIVKSDNTSSAKEFSIIWEEAEFENLKLIGTDTASGIQAGMITLVTSSSGVYRWRSFKYVSDTSVLFGHSKKSDTTSNQDSYVIPYMIVGLK